MGSRKDKVEKTNAMRLLDAAGIPYVHRVYDGDEALSGVEVASVLGQDPDRVFKTLVAQGKSGEHYVFMVPVAMELDLKKAATAAGEKSIAMVRSRELLPLTGYVHGGCSPLGMKKHFATFIDETALLSEDGIMCSGGRIGDQIELSLADLVRSCDASIVDLSC
ncbi:Cys-tRNA(Pro) deacylase [Slackia faecicanis]|uniref:Cys-tRNA(Pro)/Cys-tRNA(Cys) deacylase n=1 Tax=Slackia faecicanis TaxID=255723 RepID=A0A3N0AGV7_9ACTN|nr:Cys-tRNA(Pro) deacylase [Slackia faecicanis]RNL21285.1 Cys-tRNA(Pro) deacylase [Slackia faecicanis]